VRRTLHPVTAWLALAVIAAAGILMITSPALLPRYHDLVWSGHSGLVLVVYVASGWVLEDLSRVTRVATRAT
jgi:putative peptide zinc metalloprotease protein